MGIPIAHARSTFSEVFDETGTPIAEQALHHIHAHYAIEAEIVGHGAEWRPEIRQKRGAPLLRAMHSWCEKQRSRVSPKAELGKAFRYALAGWDVLCRYIADGRLSIDNNLAERRLCGITMGPTSAAPEPP